MVLAYIARVAAPYWDPGRASDLLIQPERPMLDMFQTSLIPTKPVPLFRCNPSQTMFRYIGVQRDQVEAGDIHSRFRRRLECRLSMMT